MHPDMKTSKSTPPSSSGETCTVQLTMPTSWSELDEQQLRYAFTVLCVFAAETARQYLFCRLASQQLGDGSWWVGIPSEDIAAASSVLDWLHDVPSVPVRLSTVQGRTAVDALLHGVPFNTYINLESLYQGYLQSKDEKALDAMFPMLYPSAEAHKPLRPFERYNILQWMTSVKQVFAQQWSEFFHPAGGETTEQPSMLEVVDAEIRALTGGDITKEAQILKIDCWRALTELDAKAREAREMKELYNKK